MTMPMNLHPQYITDDSGNRVSVVLPIEEYNTLLSESNSHDLSHLAKEVQKGIDSPVLEQSHKEIFKELKQKYA
ncbi:MAG: hypothetical protein DRG78_01350 [Epsilonproteobacteria bacterium]|nr:MAG: hypothetical protein DRG78_01350 [Campylobacterota bacterium]